ncbi:MAG: hypothetical protein ISP90_12475 [Nevskia sp.]|nr:hypothetical protein [Nevskia sp.]
MSVGDVAGPGWQAHGVTLQWDTHRAARLQAERIALAGLDGPITALALECPQPQAAALPVRCEGGHISARLPRIGGVSGNVRAAFADKRTWSVSTARLDTPFGPLALDFSPSPQGLRGHLSSSGLNLAGVTKALSAWGVKRRFAASGRADVDLQLLLRDDRKVSARYKIGLSGLTLSEPSGRYASEKLAASVTGTAASDGKSARLQAAFALPAGQLYWEPVFADFGVHPLRGQAELAWAAKQRRLELTHAVFEQDGVAQGELSGALDPAQPVATAALQVRTLTVQFPGFFEVYVKPFLAGKPYEDLQSAGHATLRAAVEHGKPARLDLDLQDLSVDSARLDAGVVGVDGKVQWDADSTAGESHVQWRGGRFGKLPLAGSVLRFRAGARGVALTAPFLQPVLDGALSVKRFEAANLGAPDLEARFDAQVEPISLDQLCRALGWPVFSGKLSGVLPGLRLHAGVLAVDGALTAQAFDGAVAVTGLRVTDPLGPLPQLSADVRMRGLDLAALTGAFSFGRIEGRLDIDVDALRLLAWRPVAFQARMQTPPADPSRHRISQRAIDNISSIGGGPTGVLSRGFMSLFKDFDYDRIGLSCVLSNGVCRMDGIGPAPNGGYYLVTGRWLPRIDVIGYTHDVSWDVLLQQVDNVRHAQKPEVR